MVPTSNTRSPRPRRGPRRLASLWLLLAIVVFSACIGYRPPVLEPLRDREPKTPVVLIPGITGSLLRDRESGRVVWGNGRSFFFPRDGGYSMALPIDHDPGGPAELEAERVITRVRVLGFTVHVYDKLVRLMEANGYRLGDLEAPRPGDTFFLFPYDWRLDNVVSAGVLLDALERLRLARGEDVLTVRLICQSNAARLARYLVKYGAAPLEEAEAGTAAPPPRIRVDKLILVGNANGGALSTLHDLNHGRSYLRLLGRKFLPEAIFTFRAVFEELPGYLPDLFFDAGGHPLDVDLFDAESWRRYGWSIYGAEAEKRLRKVGRQDLFGDSEAAFRYLARTLDRARRLHQVLSRDSAGFGGTAYYLIQNDGLPTSQRAMLVETEEGWETVFSPDPRLEDPKLASLATAPGDQHATVESQLFLSPQERAAIVREPANVPEVHRRIILRPEAHRLILEYLQE